MQDASTSRTHIELINVRVRNLKQISVKIPLKQLTILTGVSGSGKSSLAFDTLHAEGQRRYLETMSLSSKHLFTQMQRPDVDRIENLPPSIALKQNISYAKSDTRFASTCDLDLLLAELFCRHGESSCSQCESPVKSLSLKEATEEVNRLPESVRFQIVFPVDDVETEQELKVKGYSRFLLLEDSVNTSRNSNDNTNQKNKNAETLPKCFAIVDRLKAGQADFQRISEAIESAWRETEGTATILIEPISEQENSFLNQISTQEWTESQTERKWQSWKLSQAAVCHRCEIEFAKPSPKQVCQSLFGDSQSIKKNARLPQLKLHWNEQSLEEMFDFPLEQVEQFVSSFGKEEFGKENRSSLAEEFARRAEILESLGLCYLPLSRRMRNLSTGESQRTALARILMSGMVDTLYVFDEPSAGLHSVDIDKVRKAIQSLKDQGNTIVLVEHNKQFFPDADHMIDLGPGAGTEGGDIVFEGSYADFQKCDTSVTAQWLSSGLSSEQSSELQTGNRPTRKMDVPPQTPFAIIGASAKNLKSIDVAFPVNQLCVVTGVSGSGKTALIIDTLAVAMEDFINGGNSANARPYQKLTGAESFQECVVMNADPLSKKGASKNERSCPATYLKIYDEIRATFAETLEARTRKFSASDFSFNIAKGRRCKECAGRGTMMINMQFLADMPITCPHCNGTRFQEELLQARYRGKSIADVLAMTAEEAFRFFRSQPKSQKVLQTLRTVGLNYLPLGQPLSTLSGGESQRLKLATYLNSKSGKRALFLFDEPTTGLHPENVKQLLECFYQLLALGHSVIIIENDQQILDAANTIIKLGPSSGDAGGKVV